jgi:hypothetical protein
LAEELSGGERVRAWEVRGSGGAVGERGMVLVNGTSMGAHKIAIWNTTEVEERMGLGAGIRVGLTELTLVVTKAELTEGPVRIATFSAFKATAC